MDNSIIPGEILLEEYLKPMGISQSAMARAIGVAPRVINEIVHDRRLITAALSIRFGAFFGQSDEFWYRLQVECDFRKLVREEAYDADTGEREANINQQIHARRRQQKRTRRWRK